MYKVDLKQDNIENAARERRKNWEAQRASQIFNAKTRLIGVDLEALEQQRQEMRQRGNEDEAINKAIMADAVRNDMICEMMEKRQAADMRELEKSLNEFRMQHQKPETRREFDLYDPNALKKEKPARIHDGDAGLTTSGMQKFQGEDLNSSARLKFQQEQLREWSEQQFCERKNALGKQKEADRMYALRLKDFDDRCVEIEKSEAKIREALTMATRDYNKALELENAERRRSRKQQEEADNATEIANHIYGDILCENGAAAQSAWGPHRVCSDRWKGMTNEQREEVRQSMEAQLRERERLRQEEREQDKERAQYQLAVSRHIDITERQQERARRERDRQNALDNQRLAVEQKAQRDIMEKEVYTNVPTAAYWMQFNTTTR